VEHLLQQLVVYLFAVEIGLAECFKRVSKRIDFIVVDQPSILLQNTVDSLRHPIILVPKDSGHEVQRLLDVSKRPVFVLLTCDFVVAFTVWR